MSLIQREPLDAIDACLDRIDRKLTIMLCILLVGFVGSLALCMATLVLLWRLP